MKTNLKTIIYGEIELENSYIVKEFNDDNRWEDIKILPGNYSFRVLDFNGWKPRQLCINGKWRDVTNNITELEAIIEPVLFRKVHFGKIEITKR